MAHPVGVLTQPRAFGAFGGRRFGSFASKTPSIATVTLAGVLDSASASMSAGPVYGPHPLTRATQPQAFGAHTGRRFGSFAGKTATVPGVSLTADVDSVAGSMSAGPVTGPRTVNRITQPRGFGAFAGRRFGDFSGRGRLQAYMDAALDSVAGSMTAGAHRGVLGVELPSTGQNGPSLAYPTYALDPAGNGGAYYYVEIVRQPATGTLTVYNDTSFDLVGAADGIWTFTFEVFRNSVSQGVGLATVTVGDGLAPVITTQPQPALALPGDEATLSVIAGGTEPLAYQWYRGTAAIPGATSASYTLPVVAASDATAQFHVRVSNAYGADVSSTALLMIGGPFTDALSWQMYAMVRELWQLRGQDAANAVRQTSSQVTVAGVTLDIAESGGAVTVTRR